MLTITILAILAVLFVVDVVVFSYERYDWSIGIMIAMIVGAYYFTPYIKDFIEHTEWRILTVYTPAYLGIGLATALVKWFILCMKIVSRIRSARKSWDADVADRAEKFDKMLQTVKSGERYFGDYERSMKVASINATNQSHREAIEKFNNKEAGAFKPLKKEEEIRSVEEDTVALTAARTADERAQFVAYYQRTLDRDHVGRNHIFEHVKYESETAVVDALTPRAKNNKGKITIWVLQWPLVIVATIFEDLIFKIGRTAARILDALFSGLNRRLVAKATKGL